MSRCKTSKALPVAWPWKPSKEGTETASCISLSFLGFFLHFHQSCYRFPKQNKVFVEFCWYAFKSVLKNSVSHVSMQGSVFRRASLVFSKGDRLRWRKTRKNLRGRGSPRSLWYRGGHISIKYVEGWFTTITQLTFRYTVDTGNYGISWLENRNTWSLKSFFQTQRATNLIDSCDLFHLQ